MSAIDQQDRVGKLLDNLLSDFEQCYGLGSMTCSVYDTAWVACVSKTVAGRSQWLFPSSLTFVLDSQLPDGRWPAHPGQDDTDEVDSVLSTLAALFCLVQHSKNPLQLRHVHGGSLSERIERGISRVSTMLQFWSVSECKAVGFEVLVPSLLDLLKGENVHLDFPDKSLLLSIRDQKLAKVKPEILYTAAPLPILHSLEAFHGRQDFSFDRVAHHKVGGSIMASPSATSSYLIRASSWDDEAEAYLRLAISNGEGNNSGGVPSAYPSTNFELTWVASTLLETGVWRAEDLSDSYQKLVLRALDESRQVGKGLVGFAPGIEPDLDDSAKASTIFSLLGRPGFTCRIVEFFDSSQCLKTYRVERNPSVSANCNALLSIVLDSDEYPSKIGTIEKVVTFICNNWWSSSGLLNDKWSLSPFYPSMLMARSLMELLHTWESGRYSQLSKGLLQERVMPTLFQCLSSTLQSQQADGSWGRKGPREETSYAILTLASLLTLPIAQPFRPQMDSAIDHGRRFIKTSEICQPEYLWIEKVSYGSKNLANAYEIAALYTSIDQAPLGGQVKGFCDFSYNPAPRFENLGTSGLLSKGPEWLILAASVEARLWVPQLRNTLGGVFKPPSMDDDFEAIAFRWIMASNRLGLALSSQFLYDMISASVINERLIALVNDQTVLEGHNARDKIAGALHGDGDVCRQRKLGLDNESTSYERHPQGTMSNGTSITVKKNDIPTKTLLNEEIQIHCNGENKKLHGVDDNHAKNGASLIRYFEDHPSIAEASEEDKATLNYNTERFLLAQVSRTLGHKVDPIQQDGDHLTQQKGDHHHGTRANSQQFSNRTGEHPVGSPSQLADLSGFRHLLAFAQCLEARSGQDKRGRSVAQKNVANDLSEAVATVAQISKELNDDTAHCGTFVVTRDEGLEILKYEKAKIDLGLETLRRMGLGDELLERIRIVAVVAELQGIGMVESGEVE